jgi:EAL domain-containing protein (putative c-di-GMP-specific phosphodiesterase class I)
VPCASAGPTLEIARLGCELGQDFHFYRPMPVDALADALRGGAVTGA